MVESVEKRWYVLHTYAGYENKVSSNLESRIQSMGMEDNIFRVVVPEEEAHEVKNGKDKVEMKKILVYCSEYARCYWVPRITWAR